MKKINLMLILLIMFFMCGCTKRQITNVADELTAYSWENSDKFNKKISLSFNENYATMNIKTNGFEGEIKGESIIGDNSIKIFDDRSNSCYLFNYILYGDKIELEYGEDKISLNKIVHNE